MILAPSAEELRSRRTRLLQTLHSHAAAALCVFSPTRIVYLTGFAFIPTERPLALIVAGDGQTTLFVPRLEQEHAGMFAAVDEVVAYPEYPGEVHPMRRLGHYLVSRGLEHTTLAVDSDGYGGGFGYRGPALGEVLDSTLIRVGPVIDAQMAVKSQEEIRLLRVSAQWGQRAHELLHQYTAPGRTELEISDRASREATAEMIAALGSAYRPHGWILAGAHAGFRGQIGPHSAVPHAMITNARVAAGDVLVTGATAGVAGYHSELERTLIVAPVSRDAEHFFALLVAVQNLAFEALRPGSRCADVDRIVREFFETHDLVPYWRHHTGHAIGLGVPNHAAPYLDVGDQTEIVAGMVFSLEPGIYVPGLGGFRHSDTVVVTETGIESLTTYPRDLAHLTIA